jgi:hypothetical protein
MRIDLLRRWLDQHRRWWLPWSHATSASPPDVPLPIMPRSSIGSAKGSAGTDHTDADSGYRERLNRSGSPSYSMSQSDLSRIFSSPQMTVEATLVRLRVLYDVHDVPINEHESSTQSSGGSRGHSYQGVRIEIQRQDIPVPADDKRRISEAIRDYGVEGVAEYLGKRIEEPGWEVISARWITVDPCGIDSLAEAIGTFQENWKQFLIGNPVDVIGAKVGLPDASLIGVIAGQLPIPGIDKPLSDLKQAIEIAGMILGAITGIHVLACASFKLLVHDEIGRLLARGIHDAIDDLTHPAAAPGPSSPSPSPMYSPSPDGRRVPARPAASAASSSPAPAPGRASPGGDGYSPGARPTGSRGPSSSSSPSPWPMYPPSPDGRRVPARPAASAASSSPAPAPRRAWRSRDGLRPGAHPAAVPGPSSPSPMYSPSPDGRRVRARPAASRAPSSPTSAPRSRDGLRPGAQPAAVAAPSTSARRPLPGETAPPALPASLAPPPVGKPARHPPRPGAAPPARRIL